MIVAIATVALVACNPKAEGNPENADSTATEQVIDEQATIDGLSAEIANVLESKDASKLQQLLEDAKAKITELAAAHPEVAKSLLEKVQNLLNENKDKLAAVIPGWETIAAQAVALPAGLLDGAKAAGEELKDQAVDAAKDAANQAVEDAKAATVDKANEAVDKAKEAANEKVNEAADKANAAVDKAKQEAANKLLGK